MTQIYAKPNKGYNSSTIERFEKFNEKYFTNQGFEKFEFLKNDANGVPIYARNFKDRKDARLFFKTFHKKLGFHWSDNLDAIAWPGIS